MIKTDAQRERTVVQIEGFRKALAKAEQETSSKRAGAIRNSYAGMIRQLEDERNEYDQLRSGKFVPPRSSASTKSRRSSSSCASPRVSPKLS